MRVHGRAGQGTPQLSQPAALINAAERSASLFHREEEFANLRDVIDWAGRTHDGSLADLEHQPLGTVWDEVQSDSGNCMGRKCPTYKECFYYQARRRMQHAQLLVVNHALFFSDLALRRSGVNMLPEYQAVIFDEAHTLEAVASDHLGASVSSGQIDYLLSKLYNDRTNRGLLVHHQLRDAQMSVDHCRHLADEFFADVHTWLARQGKDSARAASAVIGHNRLSPGLVNLAALLRSAGASSKTSSGRISSRRPTDCKAWPASSNCGARSKRRRLSIGPTRRAAAAAGCG